MTHSSSSRSSSLFLFQVFTGNSSDPRAGLLAGPCVRHPWRRRARRRRRLPRRRRGWFPRRRWRRRLPRRQCRAGSAAEAVVRSAEERIAPAGIRGRGHLAAAPRIAALRLPGRRWWLWIWRRALVWRFGLSGRRVRRGLRRQGFGVCRRARFLERRRAVVQRSQRDCGWAVAFFRRRTRRRGCRRRSRRAKLRK